MTIELDQVVADTTALAALRIAPSDIGKSVYVTGSAAWCEAMREGAGLDKWRFDNQTANEAAITALQALGMKAVRRTVAFDDTDVAIADTTVTIDLGSALPAEAIVVGYRANNTVSWTDGSTGTFEMDLGDSGASGNEYADALDIDGGIADLVSLFDAFVPVFAGADQPSFTVTSDVNLSTATAGNTVVTIYYYVPDVTTEVAP